MNIILAYAIFIAIASLAYLIIPVISLVFAETVIQHNFLLSTIFPGLGLLLFGFCQFPAWPTLLFFINSYFNLKKEGKVTGFWAANGDVGNIIGFALTGMLMNQLEWRWESAMITSSILNIIFSAAVVFCVREKKK
jgi:sugar phosphate permease